MNDDDLDAMLYPRHEPTTLASTRVSTHNVSVTFHVGSDPQRPASIEVVDQNSGELIVELDLPREQFLTMIANSSQVRVPAKVVGEGAWKLGRRQVTQRVDVPEEVANRYAATPLGREEAKRNAEEWAAQMAQNNGWHTGYARLQNDGWKAIWTRWEIRS